MWGRVFDPSGLRNARQDFSGALTIRCQPPEYIGPSSESLRFAKGSTEDDNTFIGSRCEDRTLDFPRLPPLAL